MTKALTTRLAKLETAMAEHIEPRRVWRLVCDDADAEREIVGLKTNSEYRAGDVVILRRIVSPPARSS
jgi:hypothetical protein